MNLRLTTIRQAVTGEWVFSWTSTGAAWYRIILGGREIDSVTSPTYTFNLPITGEDPPPIEVVAERDLAVSEFNLPYIILQWYAVTTASTYRLYELSGDSWVLKDTFANNQQFLYTFTTTNLADETTARFRLVAVNEFGVESTPLGFSYKVVRPPNPVSLNFDYNSADGKITVSA